MLEVYWKVNFDLVFVVLELDMYDCNWLICIYNELLLLVKFVQDCFGSYGMIFNLLVFGGCVIFGLVVVQFVLFLCVCVNLFCNIVFVVLLLEVWVGCLCCLCCCVIDCVCVILEGMVIGENVEEDVCCFYCLEEGIVLVMCEMLWKLGYKQE